MKFLKLITKRNAFSREYGTWLIVIFNFILVPIFLQEINSTLIVFLLSIMFFLMFRFELLDIISIKMQFSINRKLVKGIIYLILSILFFSYLVYNNFIEIKISIFICITGVGMLFLNIISRRKQGKRQNIIAQITLVSFIAFLGALNYYLLTGLYDRVFLVLFILSALFYSNSVLYVRSKTVGSPYDIYAVLFSVFSMLIVILFIVLNFINSLMIIIFIPTLIKNLDNVILSNTKVPLRRIGINETLHCIIFIYLFCVLYK